VSCCVRGASGVSAARGSCDLLASRCRACGLKLRGSLHEASE
jgi:hypothetical protein